MRLNGLRKLTDSTIFRGLLIAMLVISFVLSAGNHSAYAKTQEIRDYYAKIEVKDNAYVMTADTGVYDEAWLKAGITDPKSKIKEFEEMNIKVMFYDPDTKSLVNFIVNQSDTTSETFTLEGMSDEEVIAYAKTLISAAGEDTTLQVESFKGSAYPFFKIFINVSTPGQEAVEVVYGTIANAHLYSFDIFVEGKNIPNLSFAEELVKGLSLTREMTQEEYEREARSAMIKFAVGIAAIVLLIVFIIIMNRRRNKKNKEKTKKISQAMQAFRERERDGLVSNEVILSADTLYDEELTKNFSIYHTWFRTIVTFSIGMVFDAAAIGFMLYTKSYLYVAIVGGLTAVFLYQKGISAEKRQKALDTRYGTKLKKTARFVFYEEYFTMSGVDSLSSYCYAQITDVRTFKNYLYLYMGTEHSVLINMEGNENGTSGEQLVKFLKEKTGRK